MRKRMEKQLAIYCARTHMDQEITCEVRRILEDGDLDWDYIMGNPSFYRISPLLLRNLKEIADENAVPRSAMDTLAARYAYIFYRNMQIYEILREVLERFRDEGIPVILLKGVALGETVYSDIDLRPPGDIDILVKKMDLQNAADILLKMVYNPAYPMERYRNHHHLPPHRKLDKKLNEFISIEIHHNITPEPLLSRIRAEELWEGAQAVSISGIDTLVLSPENLIMHLCIHLSYSCFTEGIGNLVDISESIRYYNGSLNWDSLVGRSNQFKIGNSVYYPLYLANEMMDANIPAYVLKGLKLHPELKPSMAKLLRTIIGRNILTGRNPRFSSDCITMLHILLCRELLGKSLILNRAKIAGSTWVRTFDRIFQRCIRKIV
jgi:hypothetical protein